MKHYRWTLVVCGALFVGWAILAFFDNVPQAIWIEFGTSSAPLYAQVLMVPVFLWRWSVYNYAIAILLSVPIPVLTWLADDCRKEIRRDREILYPRPDKNPTTR